MAETSVLREQGVDLSEVYALASSNTSIRSFVTALSAVNSERSVDSRPIILHRAIRSDVSSIYYTASSSGTIEPDLEANLTEMNVADPFSDENEIASMVHRFHSFSGRVLSSSTITASSTTSTIHPPFRFAADSRKSVVTIVPILPARTLDESQGIADTTNMTDQSGVGGPDSMNAMASSNNDDLERQGPSTPRPTDSSFVRYSLGTVTSIGKPLSEDEIRELKRISDERLDKARLEQVKSPKSGKSEARLAEQARDARKPGAWFRDRKYISCLVLPTAGSVSMIVWIIVLVQGCKSECHPGDGLIVWPICNAILMAGGIFATIRYCSARRESRSRLALRILQHEDHKNGLPEEELSAEEQGEAHDAVEMSTPHPQTPGQLQTSTSVNDTVATGGSTTTSMGGSIRSELKSGEWELMYPDAYEATPTKGRKTVTHSPFPSLMLVRDDRSESVVPGSSTDTNLSNNRSATSSIETAPTETSFNKNERVATILDQAGQPRINTANLSGTDVNDIEVDSRGSSTSEDLKAINTSVAAMNPTNGQTEGVPTVAPPKVKPARVYRCGRGAGGYVKERSTKVHKTNSGSSEVASAAPSNDNGKGKGVDGAQSNADTTGSVFTNTFKKAADGVVNMTHGLGADGYDCTSGIDTDQAEEVMNRREQFLQQQNAALLQAHRYGDPDVERPRTGAEVANEMVMNGLKTMGTQLKDVYAGRGVGDVDWTKEIDRSHMEADQNRQRALRRDNEYRLACQIDLLRLTGDTVPKSNADIANEFVIEGLKKIGSAVFGIRRSPVAAAVVAAANDGGDAGAGAAGAVESVDQVITTMTTSESQAQLTQGLSTAGSALETQHGSAEPAHSVEESSSVVVVDGLDNLTLEKESVSDATSDDTDMATKPIAMI